MADTMHIPSIDAAALTNVVGRVVRADPAEVTGWKVSPLTGGFSSTGGYKVSGYARVDEDILPRHVVLKTLQRVAAHADARDWNCWQREGLLYASGMLDRLPAALRAAHCYGVEQRSSEVVWLWLELLTGASAPRGSIQWYLTVARKLGIFNGAYLLGQEQPSQPWLRGAWLRSFASWSSLAFDTLPQQLHHPLVQRLWTPSLVAALLQLWSARETLLNVVDSLPQTFCHRDIHNGNLFPQPDACGEQAALAIDWAFAGWGAAGEDAAALLLSRISLFDLSRRSSSRLTMTCLPPMLTACGQVDGAATNASSALDRLPPSRFAPAQN